MIISSFDVDPQKGFTPLCPNELPVPEGDQIVEDLNYNASLSKFRVLSRDLHPEIADWNANTKDEEFQEVGKLNVDIKWKPHCIHGTYGSEVLEGLPHPIEGYDYQVVKGIEKDSHPYGACYQDLQDKQSTGVIEFLKYNNVTHVIVGGLATDYCVYKTVTQLSKAGFKIVLNLKSCRGISQETIEEALNDLEKDNNVKIVKNLKEEKTSDLDFWRF